MTETPVSSRSNFAKYVCTDYFNQLILDVPHPTSLSVLEEVEKKNENGISANMKKKQQESENYK
jgi:hypothetical protein